MAEPGQNQGLFGLLAHGQIGLGSSDEQGERLFVTVTDNFFLGAAGVERLHRTPQEVIELA